MTAQLTLPTCALPGCSNLVGSAGQPCDECLVACGDWLRPSGRPAPTQHELEQRDARYSQVMADRARLIAEQEAAATRQIAIDAGELRKPGQQCWLCEERRACTLVHRRWECDRCREVVA